MSELCSITECSKPMKTDGLCGMHYQRKRRSGDPSKTARATLPGDREKFYKDVVLNYEGNECLYWPFSPNRGTEFKKDGKRFRVCRLICEEIHGKPPTPKHEAAHSCGKGHFGCVTKRHLSWKTTKENQADRIVHGTSNRGRKNPKAKLNEAQVRQIIASKGNEPIKALAARFGVKRLTIYGIQSGKTWGHLSHQEPAS